MTYFEEAIAHIISTILGFTIIAVIVIVDWCIHDNRR